MAEAFILNDYTVDLIDAAGALSCGKGAQAIETAICQYLDNFINKGAFVAVCLDTHYPEDDLHPEKALFPPHNIKGTVGNQLYGKVGKKVQAILQTHPQQITVLEKNRYSAFTGTKLDLWLRSRGVTEVTISGVCTDMCVLHTAISAYNLAYKITVPRAVCYSPNQAGAEFAFSHMADAMGVNIK